MYVDECPINDDYKQEQYDAMSLVEKMEYNRKNRVQEEATEAYLEEYIATGSVEFAKFIYFRYLHLHL